MRADFSLNGVKIGSADIAADFTNLSFKAENIPLKGKGASLILRITTSGSMVPGQVAKNVFENRDLSLCFDKLTLAKAPADEELAASIFLEQPEASLKAGASFPLKVILANIGNHTWSNSGEKPVRLAIRWYDEDGREIKDDRIWLARSVPKCDIIKVVCETKAPESEGRFTVRIGPVYENVRFFPDESVKKIVVEVQKK